MMYMCSSVLVCFLFFFFKQKTAYEMRISDWSSDVCSSDLPPEDRIGHPCREQPDPAHRKCEEYEWSGSGSEVPASQARGLREGVHPARGVAEAEPANRGGNCNQEHQRQPVQECRETGMRRDDQVDVNSPDRLGQREARHNPTPSPPPGCK